MTDARARAEALREHLTNGEELSHWGQEYLGTLDALLAELDAANKATETAKWQFDPSSVARAIDGLTEEQMDQYGKMLAASRHRADERLALRRLFLGWET